MRVRFLILFLLGSIIVIPSGAYAQASIAGVVKDAALFFRGSQLKRRVLL